MIIRDRKKLGELLLASRALSPQQLAKALEEHKKTGDLLGEAVVKLGFLAETELMQALASQLGAKIIDLDGVRPQAELLRMTPESLARRYVLFPIAADGQIARVAMADPLNLEAVDALAARFNMEIDAVIASKQQIIEAINRFYPCGEGTEEASRLKKFYPNPVYEESFAYNGVDDAYNGGASTARKVDEMVRQGVRDGASDIHIEPEEDILKIRYRIDGAMSQTSTQPKKLAAAIVSRVKILAGLDIAETRAPQDGRFKMIVDSGETAEFRVSVFPTIYGECAVIRMLSGNRTLPRLDETGLSGAALAGFVSALAKPLGMTIVTGPTGSGKTTTLYAALESITTSEKTVVTIEDPVEYRLRNVRQTQINPKAGLTFAGGLRAMLRQDPDVIMIGEIRDRETAEIAAQAAMTGHLALTTLHTADAAGAVLRLVDLGVEPYKIAGTVNGVLAQRLARVLCPKCGERDEAGAGRKGPGCPFCKRTGFKGRTGVFEYLAVDEKIKELIASRAAVAAIKACARETQGMETMYEDGMRKVMEGRTTAEELDRAGCGTG